MKGLEERRYIFFTVHQDILSQQPWFSLMLDLSHPGSLAGGNEGAVIYSCPFVTSGSAYLGTHGKKEASDLPLQTCWSNELLSDQRSSDAQTER